jgi:hypothetical protein
MRKRRASLSALLFAVLLAAGTVLAFHQGWVPARYSPLAPVDLGDANAWFLDWRLAALKRDRPQCESTLKAPQIEARPTPDRPLRDGCGWMNGVHVASVGGARAMLDPLTCEAAAALALWMTHDVQPLAREHLGQRVVALQTYGTYACRNIIGNPLWRHMRSEHATANAVDIIGFALSDGRQISVRRHWNGEGAEARFLRAVHGRACRYFRVAIGPDYNTAHRDHFHYDRGLLWRCK